MKSYTMKMPTVHFPKRFSLALCGKKDACTWSELDKVTCKTCRKIVRLIKARS